MKKFLSLLLVTLVLSFTSCVKYKQIPVSRQQLVKNKEFADHLNNMNIYVHNRTQSLKLKNVHIKDSAIVGKVEKRISDKDEIERIQHPDKKAKKEHKHDINIYPVNDIDNALADRSETMLLPDDQTIKVESSNIKDIKGYAVDKKSTFSNTALLIILIVLGVALTIGMIWLIASASGSSSGSNSGSNSGDSGSGESSGASADGSAASSGASNEGSGASSEGSGASSGSCYIATMVYGSYEAPEVLILRKFRDNVLATSLFGRAFIKCYYATSPHFVKFFQNSQLVNKAIKTVLDRWVNYLAK